MIAAKSSTAFTAVLTGAPTGLVGTLTAGIEDTGGGTQSTPSTAGIVEVASGVYVATRTAPSVAGSYLVIWNNAGTIIVEELTVTTGTPGGAPLGGGTMRTFDELVDRYRSPEAGGFDVSPARAREVVNQAIRRVAIESRSVRDEFEFGPTVADQFLYTLPANVVDIMALMVGDDPSYIRLSTTQHWDLRAGKAVLPSWATGAYAPRFVGATRELAIHPVPGDGTSIIGLVALSTPDFSGSDVPPLPDDLEDAVMWAAKAIGYEEIDEDLNTAEAYSQKAGSAAAELRARETGRVGGGVIQGQIQGVHFR